MRKIIRRLLVCIPTSRPSLGDNYSIPNIFRSLADQELASVVAHIRSEPNQQFVLFTEALRVMDYWTVFQSVLPLKEKLGILDMV